MRRAGENFLLGEGLGGERDADDESVDGLGAVDAVRSAPFILSMAGVRAVDGPAGVGGGCEIEGIELSCLAASEALGTGVDRLDRALEGGLRPGMLGEFACVGPSSGGRSLLLRMLASAAGARRLCALADGADGFDPQGLQGALLRRLLWARCGSALEALKVAGALLADENFGLVAVELKGCAPAQLRGVKSADWYRLQRLAERSAACVCVFTPQLMVPSAQLRVELSGSMDLEQLDCPLSETADDLRFELRKHRLREPGGFPRLVQLAARG